MSRCKNMLVNMKLRSMAHNYATRGLVSSSTAEKLLRHYGVNE